MALGLTQPPNRNEYQEYFLGGKSGRCVVLTTLTPYANYLKIWEPQPPGTLSRPVMGLVYPFMYNETHFTTLTTVFLSVFGT